LFEISGLRMARRMHPIQLLKGWPMRIRVATLLVSAAATGAMFSQTPTVKKVPLTYTQPDDAKEMFNTYCAVCHGPDGRGGGPAATALKKAPADLTQIAIRNNGAFPEMKITEVLTAGAGETLSHGSKDMPIWGTLFKARGGESVARLRIFALTEYLKSIQRK
jgi:mono/diheme cytochrome c family protein